ncbi:MAG: DUF1080 domain-containing protein [Kiritimatiellae bacterium]|nr:DUF1080 domain-containing protein [Kiritimatiellia bacterium]
MKKMVMAAAVAAAMAAAAEVPFKLGVAGYSFAKKDIDSALAIMQAVDVHYLCVKNFHLKLDASDEEIAAFKAKLAAAGVQAVAAGPVYMSDEATARGAFDFCRRYGLKTLVGVPCEKSADGKTSVESDRMLDIVEKLVKEYGVRYAIHNHGPDMPGLFPTGESALKRIGGRDRRIGVCLDVGHEARAGADPAAFIARHGDRIFDVHMKNIKVDAKKNLAMQAPRGELKIPAIMTALAAAGYDGVCHIEYERDFEDNAMGLAESVGYYRGVMDSVKVKAPLKPVPEGANTLTAEEKAEGFELLFDGVTLPAGKWVGVKGGCREFPPVGWYVADGALTMRPIHLIKDDGNWGDLPPEDMKLGGGGDIVTAKKYRDFVFKFDFRMTEKANSGVKYFYNENLDSGTCEEYQVLEKGHPDYFKGKNGNRQIAALYDLYPAPLAEEVVKPVGEWNSGMIVSKGNRVEHWLNGRKVLAYERGSEGFRATVLGSKYAKWGKDAAGRPRPWGESAEGRLLLQDHTDSVVSYCNLKIKEL